MTIQQAAQQALDVQDACNLSGVCHSLYECVAAIRMSGPSVSTRDVNRHPIVTLFLLKMCELNGCGSTLNAAYDPAELECRRIAGDIYPCESGHPERCSDVGLE